MTLIKVWKILILGLLVLIVAACTSQAGPVPETGAGQTPVVETPVEETAGVETPAVTAEPPGDENPLANTRWMLVSFGEPGAETRVIEGTNVTLEFDETGQAGGSGGCNSFGAQYEVQDGTISFDQIITTEMACTGAGIMEQEQRYYQTLQAAGEFELSDEQLKIEYDGGQGVLNFVPGQVGEPVETPQTGDHLENTRWVLESIGPTGAVEPVVEGSMITLEFGEDNQAGGSGGCNSYGAQYEVQENMLSFGQITSTLMACADEAVTQQEQRYFEALQSAESYELSGDRLVISYSSGQGVLNFVQASP